ncbi:unnamed protein product [Ceutorhynchus assimilis]|uniref:Sm domain-containing protein n=1 Tax=Ceutorhynchus assimilis TaxID=467358 RepID=A0A9N9MCD0_9CUCU|nr:unnamed protein product [Ceutorhynchus assimilis]
MHDNESGSASNPESDEEENSEFEQETHYSVPTTPKPINTSPGALQLRSWLNKTLKIKMTDGRTLIGVFLCTDRDANIILGSCSEYLPSDPTVSNEDPRMLGLVMIPGKHIVSLHIDTTEFPSIERGSPTENLHYV